MRHARNAAAERPIGALNGIQVRFPPSVRPIRHRRISPAIPGFRRALKLALERVRLPVDFRKERGRGIVQPLSTLFGNGFNVQREQMPREQYPFLVVFSGLPGTGKTTVSKALAATMSAVYLRIVMIDGAATCTRTTRILIRIAKAPGSEGSSRSPLQPAGTRPAPGGGTRRPSAVQELRVFGLIADARPAAFAYSSISGRAWQERRTLSTFERTWLGSPRFRISDAAAT